MDYLPIAVRAYTEWRSREQRSTRSWVPTESALVLDTETTTDASQNLMFGCYRYARTAWHDKLVASCVEEGLIYADDLRRRDPRGFAILCDYAATHRASVVPGVNSRLRVLSRREFVDAVFYPVACKAQATVVTFNALFDIPRIAYDVKPARGRFQGGFSFPLWQYRDAQGVWHEDKYRPRITVKSIDSKRAIKRFTVPREVEAVDLRTDDQPDEVVFGGNLLDLRQLAYALTNEGHSLESACKTFGVPYVKRKIQHGRITPEYIDYNREDVWATAELYLKAMEEYAKCVPSV